MLNCLSAGLLACLAPLAVASGKCGNSAIVIEGLISGPAAGSAVSVHVAPDPNGNSAPPIVIDSNGRFHVTVYFDRTQPGNEERCSRKPRTVTVLLHNNGQLVDQVTLEIKRDFVSKDNTDFNIRSPITLHSH